MAWSASDRINGVATEQTIGTGSVVLGKLVMYNGDVAAQTVTVKDDTTILIVFSLAAGASLNMDFGLVIGTALKITPSDADLDILVLYDD
jgi:tetrahydromethanopterin S-methyltransferase subunit D